MKPKMELELKCAAHTGAFSRIKKYLKDHGFTIGRPKTVRFTTTYVDTPDFWYYRKGWIFRLRQNGARFLASLKSRSSAPGRLSRRQEIEGSKEKIKKVLHKWKAPIEIVPLFEIQTRRIITPCRLKRTQLALTLDRCVIKKVGVRKAAFDEIEIEHSGGSSAVARRALERLAGQPFIHLSHQGKFDRGIRAARIRLPK